MGEWFEECSAAEASSWVGEFVVADLHQTTAELRNQADFLDGKAGLLEDIMRSAALQAQGEKTP